MMQIQVQFQQGPQCASTALVTLRSDTASFKPKPLVVKYFEPTDRKG